MTKLLTQNSKMKRSSGRVYNWTLPAFRSQTGTTTCPNAKACVAGCYARQGAYVWSNVKASHEAKLALTKTEDFVPAMDREIKQKVKAAKGERVYIRIHDAGDFYSRRYIEDWFTIMRLNPKVRFYAYTKQVKEFIKLALDVPLNFNVIFSYGGKQDAFIDDFTMCHSKVFETVEDLEKAGYVDCSHDDLKVFTTGRVGLVYHGAKSYKNTTWNKVH